MKLDNGQIHLLRLTAKGMQEGDGWAKVSKAVWPLLARLPADLIEMKPSDDGGFARLTDRGETVVLYS